MAVAEASPPVRRTGPLTLATVCTATFLMLFNVTAPQVAATAIANDLGASFNDLQWVLNAYALTLASLLLTAGALADRFGRRRLFLIGVAMFSASSLLCGLAGTPLLLILARGVQGVGGAVMFATSLALIAQEFSGADRGRALGLWGAAIGAGVALGPLGGGALISLLSWEWVLLVNVPLGVATGVLGAVTLRESRDPAAGPVDWAGVATFTAALFLLVFALVRGNASGWSSPLIVGFLAGSGVLLVAFVLAERLQERPMLDLRLFRKPTFCGAAIAGFAISASMIAGVFYVTLYLLNVLGHAPVVVGLELLPFAVPALVLSTVAGRLHAHVPVRVLLAGGFVLAGGGLLLMHGVRAGSSWTTVLGGLAVGGAGVGLVNPMLAIAALGVVPTARSGMASGINNSFRQVGIATGIAGLGAIFEARVAARTTELVAGVDGVGAAQAAEASHLVASGNADAAAALVPPQAADRVIVSAERAFAAGLNDILLIAAAIALVTAALVALMVRPRDFVDRDGAPS